MMVMVMQIATFVSMPYSGSLVIGGDYSFSHRSCRNDKVVLHLLLLFLLFIGKLGVQVHNISD